MRSTTKRPEALVVMAVLCFVVAYAGLASANGVRAALQSVRAVYVSANAH